MITIHRTAIVFAFCCQCMLANWMAASEKMPADPRPLTIENARDNLTAVTRTGPDFHATKAFYGFEKLDSPRIERLRNEYNLSEVIKGQKSEFQKMLMLRNWVHSRWPIDNDQRFSGDVFAILEKAKTGAGFHCSHAMRVQHAVMTAMGYVARDLGVDCDHKEFGKSIHHGVNEVWSNQYAKWVLLDAKYDIHFEKSGVPLSALELHEAARADGGKGIVRVQGPERKPVPMKGLEFPTSSALTYWWLSYHAPLDAFTGQTRDSRLVVFDNEAFRDTTWFRGGSEVLKEHWAYAANAFLPTRDRGQIEWTPGVPDLQIRQASDTKLQLTFQSVTPNLKTYQVRIGAGAWKSIRGERFRWHLNQGKNTLAVRTQNQFGITGPIVSAMVSVKTE